MARHLRIVFPGALYHVTSRGNARQPIFLSDDDRRLFQRTLAGVIDQFRWVCHAYCLMANHYHLVIETPEANLSRGMQQLNGVYTQRFNHTHDRVGHLLQGRFKAILVEREGHLLELARYVVLNPVRAGLVDDPTDYRWSSLRATLGLVRAPEWLTVAPLLRHFASPARYLRFVHEGIGKDAPWTMLRGSVLGSESFAEEIGERLDDRVAQADIPLRERMVHRKPLEQLFPPHVREKRELRNGRIREVGRARQYTLADIARHLGLHRSTVSKIVGPPH